VALWVVLIVKCRNLRFTMSSKDYSILYSQNTEWICSVMRPVRHTFSPLSPVSVLVFPVLLIITLLSGMSKI
jgi:hypothetical protein